MRRSPIWLICNQKTCARKQKISVGDTVLICWDSTKGAKEQYYIAYKYTAFQVKELEKLGEIKEISREEDSDEVSGFTFSNSATEVVKESKPVEDTSWIDNI